LIFLHITKKGYVDLQGEALKENADLDEAFTWDDYAKHSYLDDTKVKFEYNED